MQNNVSFELYELISDFRDSIIERYDSKNIDSKSESLVGLVAIDLADLLYKIAEQDM